MNVRIPIRNGSKCSECGSMVLVLPELIGNQEVTTVDSMASRYAGGRLKPSSLRRGAEWQSKYSCLAIGMKALDVSGSSSGIDDDSPCTHEHGREMRIA